MLGKVAMNDAVTVTAQFVTYGSLRYLLLTGGELRGKGPAASLPQPVPVSTSQLPSATLGALTLAAFLMRMRRWCAVFAGDNHAAQQPKPELQGERGRYRNASVRRI